MIKHFLSFEKQISDLEGKIEELRHLSSGGDINIAEEIGKENVNNGTQSLDPLAQFVRDLSINVPILYGMFSNRFSLSSRSCSSNN